MTGFNSKREAAADKLQEPVDIASIIACREMLDAQPVPAQEPSITRPCRSCNGTGDRDTGIPESPIATCKPCNGTGQIALAQPAQEPVEYQMLILGGRWTHCAKHIYDAAADKSIVRALYTAPPKREWVGLTKEEVRQCGFAVPFDGAQDWALRFYKAIEAKLKEKNNG